MITCTLCNDNKKIVWENYETDSQPTIEYEDCPSCNPIKKQHYITPIGYHLTPFSALIFLGVGVVLLGIIFAAGIALLMGNVNIN